MLPCQHEKVAMTDHEGDQILTSEYCNLKERITSCGQQLKEQVWC
jgi:hypothetical protein